LELVVSNVGTDLWPISELTSSNSANVQFWNRQCPILELPMSNFGTAYIQFWNHQCPILEPPMSNFGTAYIQFWNCQCPILELPMSNFGTTNVQFWNCQCPILELPMSNVMFTTVSRKGQKNGIKISNSHFSKHRHHNKSGLILEMHHIYASYKEVLIIFDSQTAGELFSIWEIHSIRWSLNIFSVNFSKDCDVVFSTIIGQKTGR